MTAEEETAAAAKPASKDPGAATAQAYYTERRRQEKESWDAYWRLRSDEVAGRLFPSLLHGFKRAFDVPVTWFAENIAHPLHEKNKLPYYHRRISRVPDIDQCHVTDTACIQEANIQYRLDRNVDTNILNILENRAKDCLIHYTKFGPTYTGQSMAPCIPLMEEWEEAELNFFIKYGELGGRGDSRHCLAKQKHRLIWERRNPAVMAERAAAYKEHKRQMAIGKYDSAFWTRAGGTMPWEAKGANMAPYFYYNDEDAFKPANISKDWAFYRDLHTEGSKPNLDEKARHVYPARSF